MISCFDGSGLISALNFSIFLKNFDLFYLLPAYLCLLLEGYAPPCVLLLTMFNWLFWLRESPNEVGARESRNGTLFVILAVFVCESWTSLLPPPRIEPWLNVLPPSPTYDRVDLALFMDRVGRFDFEWLLWSASSSGSLSKESYLMMIASYVPLFFVPRRVTITCWGSLMQSCLFISFFSSISSKINLILTRSCTTSNFWRNFRLCLPGHWGPCSQVLE